MRYDLHCHILPGLDDGAGDLDDSLAMAAQADADGVGVIAATPHIRSDHDVVIGELPARVAELNAAIAAAGIGVKIVTGGEVAAPDCGGLTDDELRAVTLGGGGTLDPARAPAGADG
ncbi:CpsB/CapC family capsule biosynthesis tyrosine phosphatase [Svornostia abyssi]|uniref:CpsB/CapC family capsule biosynthesis tyrosine phosphatase n=1 Tax=Svornostia abyssi TaxID=2898438 RepID=UPI0033901225